MSLPVRWRASARADLFALYDWIAHQAGSETAYDYTTAIEARTAELRSYPHIGAPRPDLAEGIRTLVHRRRTLIAYRVTADAVEIVALAHGGRDLGGRFDPESD